jgi:2'-5' RNA ligase
METNKRLRLFVAADVPKDRLEVVDGSTEGLRGTLAGARWTRPEDRHVTLKFLGSTDPALLDPVERAIHTVASGVPQAELALGGLGAFPSTRKARVLWVGISDPNSALSALAAGLDSALGPLGFASEARPYRAHVTLARFKGPAALPELPAIPSTDPFRLDRLLLYRSHLSPKGASYEVLNEFPVGTA